MTRPTGWRRVFRLFRRSPARDIDTELRFHFEHKVAELVARGLSADAARAQANAEFGDITQVRADLVAIDNRIVEHERRAEWWEHVAQDLRHTFRSMWRAPGFTAMVAVTLALGLGANAAIFSVLERLFWRQPSGVAAPNEVRRVHQVYADATPTHHQPRSVFAYPEIRAIARALPADITLAGFRTEHMQIGQDNSARKGVVVLVVGDYFDVLGVRPAAGRFFSADESRAETFSPVAVISYRTWAQQYAGASSVIGQPFDIGSHRYTIIGVAPPAFIGTDLDVADAWVPLSTRGRWKGRDAQWYERRGSSYIHAIARVKTVPQALATEAAATRGLRETHITDTTGVAVLASLIEPVWPDGGARQLTTATRLAGVALIILLIACANVANLLLARGMQRRREIAIRLALGVRRGRLVAQLLVESIALASVAGMAAIVFGAWGARVLRNALLPDVIWGEGTFGVRIVLFTAGMALITGFAAGLAPALQASRPDLIPALKGGARDGARRSRLRTGLVIAQAALSVVLLASAGLFVRSLRNVETTDIGYDASRILMATVSYDREGDSHDVAPHMADIADRIAQLPGVEHVALTALAPFYGFGFTDTYLPHGDSLPRLNGGGPLVSFVSPGFFETTGMHVLQGRGFEASDRAGARLVLVVNETMARTVWPEQGALGKCLIIDSISAPCREVVGVVSNVHFAGIVEHPSMQFYLPLVQAPKETPGAILIHAAPGRTHPLQPAVRDVIIASLGAWARPGVYLMSDELEPQLRPWRLSAMLFSSAGLLALLVAVVGIYSSVAYAISQRMHEMGVRMALGARSTHIVQLVVGEGARAVLAGVGLGLGLALALGRVVASLLYNTSAHDPVVLGAVAATLLGVAILACLIPAWRATRADPVSTLRAE